MQYVDQFREPVMARNVLREIEELGGKSTFVTHHPRRLQEGLRCIGGYLQTTRIAELASAAISGLAEMHELALTRNIVETVAAHAQGRRVRRVTLEVGGLACVMPSALQFCFEVATLGTALEGASLDIIQLEAQARCRVCGNTFVQRAFWEPCHCGAHDFTRISGEELRVKQYEVDAS